MYKAYGSRPNSAGVSRRLDRGLSQRPYHVSEASSGRVLITAGDAQSAEDRFSSKRQDYDLVQQQSMMQDEIAGLSKGVASMQTMMQQLTDSLAQDGRLAALQGRVEGLDHRFDEILNSRSKEAVTEELQQQIGRISHQLSEMDIDGMTSGGSLRDQIYGMVQQAMPSEVLDLRAQEQTIIRKEIAQLRQAVSHLEGSLKEVSGAASASRKALEETETWQRCFKDTTEAEQGNLRTLLEVQAGLNSDLAQQVKAMEAKLEQASNDLHTKKNDQIQCSVSWVYALEESSAQCKKELEAVRAHLEMDGSSVPLAKSLQDMEDRLSSSFHHEIAELDEAIKSALGHARENVEQLQVIVNDAAPCRDRVLKSLQGGLMAVLNSEKAKREELEKQVMDRIAEISTATVKRVELAGIEADNEKRFQQMQSTLDSSAACQDFALQGLKGDLSTAALSEEAIRERIAGQVMERLRELESSAAKRSELADISMEAEKRFQQMMDEQRRSREVMEDSVQQSLRSERTSYTNQISEQWDREQKTRETHREHYTELVSGERTARELALKVYDQRLDDLEQRIKGLRGEQERIMGPSRASSRERPVAVVASRVPVTARSVSPLDRRLAATTTLLTAKTLPCPQGSTSVLVPAALCSAETVHPKAQSLTVPVGAQTPVRGMKFAGTLPGGQLGTPSTVAGTTPSQADMSSFAPTCMSMSLQPPMAASLMVPVLPGGRGNTPVRARVLPGFPNNTPGCNRSRPLSPERISSVKAETPTSFFCHTDPNEFPQDTLSDRDPSAFSSRERL